MGESEPLGIDMRQALAQIDRMQAETRRFAAEQNKLAAEADKLRRDRFLAPIAIALTGVGTGAALFAAAQAFLKIISS